MRVLGLGVREIRVIGLGVHGEGPRVRRVVRVRQEKKLDVYTLLPFSFITFFVNILQNYFCAVIALFLYFLKISM